MTQKAKPKKAAKPKPKEEDEEPELDDEEGEGRGAKQRRSRCRKGRSWPSWRNGTARNSRRRHRRKSIRSSRPCTGANYVVTKVEQKDRQEKPPAPFTTSTLQQQASLAAALHRQAHDERRPAALRRRGSSAARGRSPSSPTCVPTARASPTMRSRRAASTSRTTSATSICRTRRIVYAARRMPRGPTKRSGRPICPTRRRRSRNICRRSSCRLYTLIYNRFVACQMTPAMFAVTNVEITRGQGRVQGAGQDAEVRRLPQGLRASSKQEDMLLPPMKETDPLNLLEAEADAALHRAAAALQRGVAGQDAGKGRHRPAQHLCDDHRTRSRNAQYVEVKERRFYATELGMKVTDLLVKHFPKVMDLTFTRSMEEELDQIETKKFERNQVLQEISTAPSRKTLKKAETQMLAEAPRSARCAAGRSRSASASSASSSAAPATRPIRSASTSRRRLSKARPPARRPAPTGINCPTCGKEMVKRPGKRGPFLGCSGYPECKTTMNFDAEGKPVVTSQPTEYTCEKCGSPMVQRMGSAARSSAAAPIPSARTSSNSTPRASRSSRSTPASCARSAAGRWSVKRGFRGPFLGCSRLSDVPQHQAVAGGIEGKAQGGRRRRPGEEEERGDRCAGRHQAARSATAP